jgi:predicted RNA binding protein YcfA (HicA-like mRNA interferase family)
LEIEARQGKPSYLYLKENNIARISVPVHGNTPLKAGLLKYLMKVAEITEPEL